MLIANYFTAWALAAYFIAAIMIFEVLPFAIIGAYARRPV